MRRKLAAGNWKMNGLAASLEEVAALTGSHPAPRCEVLICPPATLLSRMADTAAGGPIAIGGQDCPIQTSGAQTGDISAAMLADAGAEYVIVGHSERRADHGETDDLVQDKARAAWDAGLSAIICVGETLAEREGGKTLDVVGAQLAGSVPGKADGA
ncbi:MAG: triose-phosphate isomerase, partial [Pseudomonadota bacterium]